MRNTTIMFFDYSGGRPAAAVGFIAAEPAAGAENFCRGYFCYFDDAADDHSRLSFQR